MFFRFGKKLHECFLHHHFQSFSKGSSAQKTADHFLLYRGKDAWKSTLPYGYRSCQNIKIIFFILCIQGSHKNKNNYIRIAVCTRGGEIPTLLFFIFLAPRGAQEVQQMLSLWGWLCGSVCLSPLCSTALLKGPNCFLSLQRVREFPKSS